jgi:hypothetical protein
MMAGGKLRCLGSSQHLKSRFGEGYVVDAKVASASDGSGEEGARKAAAVRSGRSSRAPASDPWKSPSRTAAG